ncbi:MAG: DUF72 domain-containing protein [Verrucomicrobiales bacterium]|nr:DUF72 domain-containing protein [Verrucomicrobiales bacterium]
MATPDPVPQGTGETLNAAPLPNPFPREPFRKALHDLAGLGLYLGTSSWKYAGWIDQLYTRDRYVYRGRFAETRFERLCLAEYAEVFPTVCVDAAYYQFPTPRFLEGLAAQVPAHFQFTFKVTDEITVRRFPQLPRFGARAGQLNPHFLDADRFTSGFLAPCEPFRSQIGVLIFEFSRFYPADFARGRDFVEALDGFLSRLPAGWRYGVEIRNPTFLHPDYFGMLARHGVAHVFNSWEAMPALAEQFGLAETQPAAGHGAARLLLRPGRAYEDAVKAFAPYNQLRDAYPEGRAAAANYIRRVVLRTPGLPRSIYLYVNNRFEGNALVTLRELLREAGWLKD